MKHLLLIISLVLAAVSLQAMMGHANYKIASDIKTDYISQNRVVIKFKGDVNKDGEVNISDISAVINLILGDVADNNGDVNDDGEINIGDINAVIDIIFGGGIDAETFTVNGVSFNMIYVENDTFTMGATEEQSSNSWEKPSHKVTLTSSYLIGQTEVTQELWLAVMGTNPAFNQNDLQRPVENVNWDDCQQFINELKRLTGRSFRLPTEAEWEFAARGGNKSHGYIFAGSNNIDYVAWYANNSENQPHAVAGKSPNELGLYDMSGNVYEWCQDWYSGYTDNAQIDPSGPESGQFRILRGGSSDELKQNCQVFHRNYSNPLGRNENLGLRLALSLDDTAIPVITTQMDDNTMSITATGDGTVKLYCNEQLVANPHIVYRGETDYTITVYATAQEEGKNMSQSETMDITVPALEYTAIPVISTQTTEYAVTISASGDGIVKLYVNGQQVSNPYIASRSNSAYTITAYATAKEDGKVMSHSEPRTITVPALVYSAVPVISTQTTETAVIVTASGSGTVKLYVNGQQVSNPYTAARGNSDYTITTYATAKESGKVLSQSEPKTITVPALVYTDVPVVSTQTTETAVKVTASGSGTVKLYVNGQQVSNPYTAERGNSAYTITAYATAKEDGKVLSQSEPRTITVPALVYTEVPVVSTQTTETAVIVTATGSGTVKLYVNGQQVSNPYTAERGNSAYTITAYATAKESGKILSQSETITITVPALTIEPSTNSFTVNGVTFKMVTVNGGMFLMGATPEQGEYVRDNEKPVHEVTLSSYLIGQTEVTQELWLAVMGSNPSHHTGNLQRPVDMVSWVDCQEFISRLNQLTGKTFRLPTEAEWEFAARGGNYSQGYRYAGSNDMLSVAWCENNSENSTHPVGTKIPNELGIYDMTGNVWEWCNDWYKLYTAEAQFNPTGPETGNNRVLRGGCWNGDFIYNRISYRDNFIPTGSNSSGGLRLALDIPEVYTVNGVSFTMVPVSGGTFLMGATEEQGDDFVNWERPVHEVTLSSYCIGQTEVTQELWLAVMGTNPSKNPGDLQRPVENVTWTDCQEFIAQLNALTGRNFRLPTEAEWEFAARGGNESKGYKYSGSNNVNDVAWIADGTHAVAQLQPNELYLYDMSGNVEEWIWDYFDYYTSDPQTDPMGPETGTNRVYRGGSWYSGETSCRVSFRMHRAESFKRGTMGFRLAL